MELINATAQLRGKASLQTFVKWCEQHDHECVSMKRKGTWAPQEAVDAFLVEHPPVPPDTSSPAVALLMRAHPSNDPYASVAILAQVRKASEDPKVKQLLLAAAVGMLKERVGNVEARIKRLGKQVRVGVEASAAG